MSDRALGRATLARQGLLSRSGTPVLEMVEHLCGLQAQAPMPPYFALWARIEKFRPNALSELIENREVVRIVAMRGTVFALSAADALTFRPLIQPILDRDLHTNTQHRAHLEGIDVDALAAVGRDLVRDRPLTQLQMRPLLEERFPGRDGAALAHGVRALVPMVQVPPRGVWGKSGQPALATLESWVGRPLAPGPSLRAMMLRYLAAFGPASARDAQAWSGLTRLGEVLDDLRPQLRVFTGESGTELFDLPDAPRPKADVPAPVRILAPFDNVLLSHADRSRILDDALRKQIFTQNGIIKPAVLVGGRVVGFTSTVAGKDGVVLEVEPLTKIAKSHRSAVEAEGRRLLKFAHPDADNREVRFRVL
ncbi:winged helix DNA-binding domain-containing protein [Rhodococcus sp. FXJ9.536]|uniref:Winged helix DNA-binding domain-containing protein n=2 Tax=Rhodococcus tibetensis TaxID=2965064 RepID=A0ABT1QC19_9NOCA|nr:winged helix DNA-binding domain-containing protein [Rhodococcus sp. FXJ9.536]MCQ4119816.1 winged helix DNA-binding domain-containing protein [Rhodococcus sp. FXJ9.536]